ncbi:MAG: hypothetical protein NTX99_02075, partial [Candidatus Aminicenantes bacterium]|nr:hypothetical protein [Candidatus Aminicenantes bacterium]
MRTKLSLILVVAIAFGSSLACKKDEEPAAAAAALATPVWTDLFAPDLSDAEFPAGIWTVADGVITASEDQALWTKKDYQNFVLDL